MSSSGHGSRWFPDEVDDLLPPPPDDDELVETRTHADARRAGIAGSAACRAERAFGALLGVLTTLDDDARHAVRHVLAQRQALALFELIGTRLDPLGFHAEHEDEPGGAIDATILAAHPDLTGAVREGVTLEVATTLWQRVRRARAAYQGAAMSSLALHRPPNRALLDVIDAAGADTPIVDRLQGILKVGMVQTALDLDLPREADHFKYLVEQDPDENGKTKPPLEKTFNWIRPGMSGHNETIAALLPLCLPGLDPLARASLVPPDKPPVLLPAAAWLLPLLKQPEKGGGGLADLLDRGLRQDLLLIRRVLDAVAQWRSAAADRRRHSSVLRIGRLFAARPVLTTAQAAHALELSIRGARIALEHARDARLLIGRDTDGIRRYHAPAFLA